MNSFSTDMEALTTKEMLSVNGGGREDATAAGAVACAL